MNTIVVTSWISLNSETVQKPARNILAEIYQYPLVSYDANGCPDTANQDHKVAFDKLIRNHHPVTIEWEVTREGALIPKRIL